jgi:hypothetical protein
MSVTGTRRLQILLINLLYVLYNPGAGSKSPTLIALPVPSLHVLIRMRCVGLVWRGGPHGGGPGVTSRADALATASRPRPAGARHATAALLDVGDAIYPEWAHGLGARVYN